MKVHVLKSKTGKVIATFQPKSGSGPTLEPQVSKGQTVHEIEVPQDYVSNLDTVYKKATKRK